MFSCTCLPLLKVPSHIIVSLLRTYEEVVCTVPMMLHWMAGSENGKLSYEVGRGSPGGSISPVLAINMEVADVRQLVVGDQDHCQGCPQLQDPTRVMLQQVRAQVCSYKSRRFAGWSIVIGMTVMSMLCGAATMSANTG